jgi:F5/8 type C domain-containing protein
MRAIAFAIALVFAAGTGGPPPKDQLERGNLLNIALGASVVSRTAELTLDQSAVRAIDGDPESAWNSPPNDGKDQTIVFALPARALIEKIGIRTPQLPRFRVTAIQCDWSVDGVTFTPLATLKLAVTDDVQRFPITPREMAYLRVTTIGVAERFARIQSVQAFGKYVEPIRQLPLEGCWTINGLAASFMNDRGRVTGVIGGHNPISFDGGTDGLVYRFAWASGPNWGFGAIDTAPDKKHLSGLRWYVEPISYASAESWFGARSQCSAKLAAQDVVSQFLKRAGRFPLYGLRFDDAGALVEADSAATLDMLAALARAKRYRLVSREFRQANGVENRRHAQGRLDSLRAAMQRRGIDPARFDWSAAGSDSPPRAIENEIMRTLYGVVELQPL